MEDTAWLCGMAYIQFKIYKLIAHHNLMFIKVVHELVNVLKNLQGNADRLHFNFIADPNENT